MIAGLHQESDFFLVKYCKAPYLEEYNSYMEAVALPC